MKKLYEKNEQYFALIWIGIYVALMSAADSISQAVGTEKLVTAPICIALSLTLFLWIRKNGLMKKYGLCRPEADAKKYLYYIPLVLLASTNLWQGFHLNMTPVESALYVASMLCVGFLEEVIFRGFLFRALCSTNVTRAVIISSVTFGLGHIINLLNGRNIPETLMQICYAIAIGFLFTILFYRGKGLWPCIITHGVLNSLSAFGNEARQTVLQAAACVFLCVVSAGYALYILKKTKP